MNKNKENELFAGGIDILLRREFLIVRSKSSHPAFFTPWVATRVSLFPGFSTSRGSGNFLERDYFDICYIFSISDLIFSILLRSFD